ncbi:hypothetical protein [Hymenobacter terricola]|uniref:hypothetical protein n=1 Tax=Hymenobacter terricola TaxID=2819236 RepID=UPI001B314CAF|nr:hypothetical protein [Hymenobacter terricola]
MKNTLTQQRCELWAANLLLFTVLLGGIASFLDGTAFFDGGTAYGEKAKTALALALVVGTVFAARRGHTWAKGLLVLYYLLAGGLFAYFHFTAGLVLGFTRGALTATLQVTQWLLQFVAFLLLLWSFKRNKLPGPL